MAPVMAPTVDTTDEVSPKELGYVCNPYRYAGYEYIEQIGIYDLNARYYNPEIARFLSADPYYNLGNRVIGVYEINVPTAASIMQANNIYAYCGNSPIIFTDENGMILKAIETFFVDGWKRIKQSVRDSIDSGEKYLRNHYNVDTAKEGAELLDMFEDENGVFHANIDCWQATFGYNVLYDFFFDMGTSMLTVKYQFLSADQEYIIWAWKGDYVNLGAGAELGIYQRADIFGIDTPQWEVNKNIAMNMTLVLKDSNGNQIINYSPNEKQWWITGFNPAYQDIDANDLTAIYTITFDNKEMFNDFYSKYGTGATIKTEWKFDSDSYTATLTF